VLNLADILRDGAILSVLASIILMGTLWLRPRLFLQDYPKEIRAVVPPKTEEEKRLSLMVGIPFLLVLIGFPFGSTLILQTQSPSEVPFWALFLNSFGIVFIFNVVDWLVLDWLIVCTITPKFLVLPGTQGHPSYKPSYKNYAVHFRGFLIGTVFSALAALVIAVIALIF